MSDGSASTWEDMSVESGESQTPPSEDSTCTPRNIVDTENVEKDECFDWQGFKIVGDNINKNVKPRQMREDHQAKMLNYFYVYDRVDFGSLPDNPPQRPCDVDVHVLLPTADDLFGLKFNLAVLVARVLCKHIPFFKKLGHVVTQHIPHMYSVEMAQRSEVVSRTDMYKVL